jgi:hypothetical protein
MQGRWQLAGGAHPASHWRMPDVWLTLTDTTSVERGTMNGQTAV